MNELLEIQQDGKGKEYEKWAFLYSSSKWGWTGPLIRTVWTAAWQQSFSANHWEEGGSTSTSVKGICDHLDETAIMRKNINSRVTWKRRMSSVTIKPIWTTFLSYHDPCDMLNWEKGIFATKGARCSLLHLYCGLYNEPNYSDKKNYFLE